MDSLDIAKIIATQSIVFIATILVAYLKLRHDLTFNIRKQIDSHRLERLEKQLSEFYAPLHMLSLAATELVGSTWATPEWDKAFKEGLLPLHEQMEVILISKAHLIDTPVVPESYVRFLRHIRTVRCYRDTGLTETYFRREEEYPKRFNLHIAKAYRERREQYIRAFNLNDAPEKKHEGFNPEYANEA